MTNDSNSPERTVPQSVVDDAISIVQSARKNAVSSINAEMVKRNWFLGKIIIEEELRGNYEENYGKRVIVTLSKALSIYGKGFSASNLYKYAQFYKNFPKMFSPASGSSLPLLSWSHFRILMMIQDEGERMWYYLESSRQMWSVRTLQRNVDSQYYYRMLKAPDPEKVESEMKEITSSFEEERLSFIKDPVVVEFLGLSPDSHYTESDLETCILNNLEKFLLEMGKGYAFMGRQQLIRTEGRDYYIDLVFYNVYMKCYVLIDLKTTRVEHQDVGQMEMYVRMYDDLKRTEGDNPTLGIILCSKTDENISRYSILHDNDRLFASKYVLYLPSEEQLRNEIEAQKRIFDMRMLDAKLEKGDE